MSLSNLIRGKSEPARFATAIPATFATPRAESGRTVATVATVAVAKSEHEKPAKVGADGTATAPMTADEEAAIRAWLALIEETDPVIIADVLTKCQVDPDGRDYFIQRAVAGLPKPDPFPDDRRTCDQCANLRQRACAIAKPEAGALLVANQGYRPDPARLMRCEGYAPKANDPDQRPGAELWPGLFRKGGE